MQPTKKILSTILLLLTLIGYINAKQSSDCKVLMKTINETYQGGCKNGLAHGEGIATGDHVYKGEFKKGLPHGHGKYVWDNNKKIYEGEWKKGKKHGNGKLTIKKSGKDSVVTGIWKEGKLKEHKEIEPYEVLSKSSIERIRIYRNGSRDKIIIKLRRHGSSKQISNLLVNVSSGAKHDDSRPITVKFPKFPFKGNLQFKAPNKFDSSKKTCRATFKINEPGHWVVELTY